MVSVSDVTTFRVMTKVLEVLGQCDYVGTPYWERSRAMTSDEVLGEVNDLFTFGEIGKVQNLLNDKFCPENSDEISSEGWNLSPEDEKLFSKVSGFVFYGFINTFGTDEEMTDAINYFLAMEK